MTHEVVVRQGEPGDLPRYRVGGSDGLVVTEPAGRPCPACGRSMLVQHMSQNLTRFECRRLGAKDSHYVKLVVDGYGEDAGLAADELLLKIRSRAAQVPT